MDELEDSGEKKLRIKRNVLYDKPIVVDGFHDWLQVENARALNWEERDKIKYDGDIIYFTIALLTPSFLIEQIEVIVDWIKTKSSVYTLVLIDENTPELNRVMEELPHENLFTVLSSEKNPSFYLRNLSNAFNQLYSRMETLKIRTVLAHRQTEIAQLTKIGEALADEKDHNKLLELILDKAREITRSDGGSIYLVDQTDPTKLHFKLSALNLNASQYTLPVDKTSLAGYVALTGRPLKLDDVYAIPANAEYRFNATYDKEHSYRTKSMLVLPMRNHKEKVVGVLQLINRKRNFYAPFDPEKLDDIIPYDPASQTLALAVAGQATVAIENNMLITEIEGLFEGFIEASVSAIESRDPTTSGHSFRVADLTVNLAQIASNSSGGIFNAISFNETQLREIRYASLLHDFGKIGVREEVLVKAKKLYPMSLELIKWRFEYIKKCLEVNLYQSRTEFLHSYGAEKYPEFAKKTQKSYDDEMARLNAFYESIINANEPRILEGGEFERIQQMTKLEFDGPDSEMIPLLYETEARMLSIPKGTLDDAERAEIESHVVHTYNFLKQIPWTDDLRMVPEIAKDHHEKIDGSGYPHNLHAQDIVPQTRMMTIADIYDALTSPDRPYKKGVPVKVALDILNEEAGANRLDRDLLDLFINAEVFDVLGHKLKH